MTRDAIDAIGDMHTIVNKGETVLIEPNLASIPWAKHNNCFRTGECTKCEMIISVMEELRKTTRLHTLAGFKSHVLLAAHAKACLANGLKHSREKEGNSMSVDYICPEASSMKIPGLFVQ